MKFGFFPYVQKQTQLSWERFFCWIVFCLVGFFGGVCIVQRKMLIIAEYCRQLSKIISSSETCPMSGRHANIALQKESNMS